MVLTPLWVVLVEVAVVLIIVGYVVFFYSGAEE